ncbi:MAG: 2,3-bisphosphoglycerate-independent phosphoglycerate mutase [Patescibacteria group bacterium]
MSKQTVLLIILDGWGVPKKDFVGSAITRKTAPNFFNWLKEYPHTTLEASGAAVGLENGQEGNSEAGHLNIGAGRVVKQDMLYIQDAIKDGSFVKNNAFHQALHHAEKYHTAVHVMGLLSNHNSAHSCPEHLYALLDFLQLEGVKKVYLHLFTYGRDSGQHDAQKHFTKLLKHLPENSKVATVMGRYYGMDRNKMWDRTEAAYDAIVGGQGKKANDFEEALTIAYNSGETDEFVSPTVIMDAGRPVATVKDNDVIFYFNLRSDRARQLTKAFIQSDFGKDNPGAFHRKLRPKNIRFVAMTDFGPDLPGILTAFPSRDVQNSLVQVLCPRPQLYISESEKFAHVTYFFNGGYAQHFCNEKWVKIESDHVKDFDGRPAMKAGEIIEYLAKAIESGSYEFITANFANADMIGHTGNLPMAEKSVKILNNALLRIVNLALEHSTTVIITADHGNAEEMINTATGEVDSEHSVNPVPFMIIASREEIRKRHIKKILNKGKLADIAPTILKLMDIPQPAEMTGRALY